MDLVGRLATRHSIVSLAINQKPRVNVTTIDVVKAPVTFVN